MAGHSKWHNIAARKGAQDKKRSNLFTKISRDIASAAKEGGADATTNPRLKTMMDKARVAGMPKDNITRAINRGAGIGESGSLTSIVYEGKGPGGIDIVVEARTDNKNRTASEIKHIFSRNGGALGAPGSSLWNFDKKGFLELKMKGEKGKSENEMLILFDVVGIIDIETNEEGFDVYTAPGDLMSVREELEKMGYEVLTAKLMLDPKSTTKLEGEVLEQAISLLEQLDEQDDADAVYTNLE